MFSARSGVLPMRFQRLAVGALGREVAGDADARRARGSKRVEHRGCGGGDVARRMDDRHLLRGSAARIAPAMRAGSRARLAGSASPERIGQRVGGGPLSASSIAAIFCAAEVPRQRRPPAPRPTEVRGLAAPKRTSRSPPPTWCWPECLSRRCPAVRAAGDCLSCRRAMVANSSFSLIGRLGRVKSIGGDVGARGRRP